MRIQEFLGSEGFESCHNVLHGAAALFVIAWPCAVSDLEHPELQALPGALHQQYFTTGQPGPHTRPRVADAPKPFTQSP